jgi:hypothetical protein
MMPYKDTWCEVAVKVMLVEEGMDQAESFHNEVILLGGLKHPNLVRLLGENPTFHGDSTGDAVVSLWVR